MSLAKRLIAARSLRRTTPRPRAGARFDLAEGYRVAAEADAALRASGWRHAGRKLGFTNPATWEEFDLATPIWAWVYDRTVIHASGAVTEVMVSDLVAPRIEPEIVLGLNAGIAGATSEAATLLAAIEWIAPGFEIVDCHYAGWAFDAGEIVADFGAHARLVIGPRVPVAPAARMSLPEALTAVEVELCRGDELLDTGRGCNALGGPVAALGFLVDALAAAPPAERLAPGEFVTTGTLTAIPYVFPDETWRAVFAGAGLSGLAIRLV